MVSGRQTLKRNFFRTCVFRKEVLALDPCVVTRAWDVGVDSAVSPNLIMSQVVAHIFF